MTAAPKPVTAAQLIPEGSALKRPTEKQEMEARVLNSMELSPKAKADRQRQAEDRARVSKVRAEQAKVKPGSMADRMYGAGAAAQRAHDAKPKTSAGPRLANQGLLDWHKGQRR